MAVWTPKRILLLAVGFFVFGAIYLGYSHFLGSIDGLPPLPQMFEPLAVDTPPSIPPPPRMDSATQKLQMAFGEGAIEVKRKIKLELQKGIVLSTQDIIIRTDGLVELVPFSIAIFGKDRGDGGYPEINTVQAYKAILTFDKPIKNVLEVGSSNAKIVRGELQRDPQVREDNAKRDDDLKDIKLYNNRRTKERGDDISVFTPGPIFYEESRHLVYTRETVKIVDPQPKGEPNIMSGNGLTLTLATDSKGTPSPQGSGDNGKRQSVTGVESIVLQSNVDMTLWADGKSGFLGGSRNQMAASATPPPTAAPTTEPSSKVRIVIHTLGRFVYDMRNDKAMFDIQFGKQPNVVTVYRFTDPAHNPDQLECDHLELQFHRKDPNAAPAQAGEQAEGLAIETAHATGKLVVLKSETDFLDAIGNDLFYDRPRRLTTLKGSPRMWAMKEGNDIEAPELQLLDIKGGQQATAIGEGRIRMMDKAGTDWPMQAAWKEKLIYTKDGPHDLLTLIGDAAFEDHEHQQKLTARILKVWLEPSDQLLVPEKGPAKGKDSVTGKEQDRRKPHHLDAVGNVAVSGTELVVHDTDHLEVWFKDVPESTLPAGNGPMPASNTSVPAVNVGASASNASEPAGPAPSVAATAAPAKPDSAPSTKGTPSPTKSEPSKNKNPIDLSARLVRAHVLRAGPKNDLDKLWCEGTPDRPVKVHQEPSSPDERGVDIAGETLDLKHHPDGNVLKVTGEHARVQINKLFILGPEVNIDQTSNQVWVNGLGVMRMPSKANMDGSPSARETQMTINWDKTMYFNGLEAKFGGNVRAEQDTGRLGCEDMEVRLDRRVSLKEGEKAGQSPKVQKLLCDKQVWVIDVRWENGKLDSCKRMDSQQLVVDNDEESQDTQVQAAGPGVVRTFQKGGQEELSGQSQAKAKAAKSKDEQTKLTHISYLGRMDANNKRGLATFYDRVIVIQVPTTNPDLPIDESRPPPEAMYMSCDKLEVKNIKQPNGKATQEMYASRKVFVRGEDYSGSADIAKYDESKDELLILEGVDGKYATLYRQKAPGQPREEIKARKIFYWRKTGEFKVEEGQEMRGLSK
jgi:hypothetical protein